MLQHPVFRHFAALLALFLLAFLLLRSGKPLSPAEHGAAPAERVGRVVDGVFRRLDDEAEPPRHARIAGDREKWAELLATLKDEAG